MYHCGYRVLYPTHALKPGPKTGENSNHIPFCYTVFEIMLGKPGSSRRRERHQPARFMRIDVASSTSDNTSRSARTDTQASHTLRDGSISTSPGTTFNNVQPGPLSQILHPSHDASGVTGWQTPTEADAIAPTESVVQFWESLQISPKTYHYLLKEYFDNMVSFSLFHKPSFHKKLRSISPVQAAALLASMFQYSARLYQSQCAHRREADQGQVEDNIDIPMPEHFERLGQRFIGEAMEECDEETPSLCVLQALILSTFHQLAQKVRGRAWRSVGTLTRIAYELQLHRVDSETIASQPEGVEYDKQRWVLDEERRRAWWAIWEFDVFASTIRRLPTGIDSLQTEVFLPVDDEAWFSGRFRSSCLLDLDPSTRWKTLERSGNTGWKSWYIVINSMMRDAHLLSYSRGTYGIIGSPEETQANKAAPSGWTLSRSPDAIEEGLAVLANSLCCYEMALPPSIAYHGEYLKFSVDDSPIDEDCAKHSIYTMTQLSRFMIHYYEIFWAKAQNSTAARAHPVSSVQSGSAPDASALNNKAWVQYLDAADSILRLVRNCSPCHVRYVNPLFASTIWLATVAQIVCKVFNPVSLPRRLTQSKLDVLQGNFNAYVSFWGTSNALQQKLNTLESRLESLRHLQGSTEAVTGSGPPAGAGGTDQSLHAAIHGESRHTPCDAAAFPEQATPQGVHFAAQTAMSDFYPYGPVGLIPTDATSSLWPMNMADSDAATASAEPFNFDVGDFLAYAFDG